ncbi:MAG: MFS transporter [Paludibacteraceae bacterium]|nr:MFS transporter [Paludibacteraceae bacterium]
MKITMNKRNLSFGQLFNLSFGFFGVQIAYALQSANISRIFATLGADPHQLSFFWFLPPLMGMIVQPIIGILSDKTWFGKIFGRRKFYLLVGALIAVVVMVLLPNAGDFTFEQRVMLGLNSAMWFGLFSLMFLDTSINIAMQPFKMMVGDMVNEEQKGKAYAIQSALCNAGSVVGYLFPIFFTWIGIANEAPEGVIPDSVKWSFYCGAAILILCSLYTFAVVREMDPKEYAEFHGLNEKKEEKAENTANKGRIIRAFITVGLVQFFCWAAFLYMWTYSNGALAINCFGWDGINAKDIAFQDAGNWVGVVFCVQAVGSLIWAAFLPKLEHWLGNKGAYAVSLVVGALGFISIYFVGDLAPQYDATIVTDGVATTSTITLVLLKSKYVVWGSYFLIGAAWAAMLALPFTIITNAISGSKYMGALLGLFNCTICIPQIVASFSGKPLLNYAYTYTPANPQAGMLILAGILLLCGAACVFLIKEK